MILEWWTPNSPYKNKDGIIADGSIRSGKTTVMSLSFVIWAMDNFDDENFALCGKTIQSLRRNVIKQLKRMLKSMGYTVEEHRTENSMTIRRGDVENEFYLFGGKDEGSQDLIQGITLAGVLFDEVALMPESFVNQATGRCSVTGSKMWFNCNPEGPDHYIKTRWIDRISDLNLIRIHFTMQDNPSLSKAIIERYEHMYTGVFYDRFIKGLWVLASGIIFRYFADDNEPYLFDDNTESEKKNVYSKIVMGIDFGGNGSKTTFCPEVAPAVVQEVRPDIIFGTGRSDYPNQINNVICFPFLFRGALDVRACEINLEIKKAAMNAIRLLAQEPVPDEVLRLSGEDQLEFGKHYIMPKAVDHRLYSWVSKAVAKAAIASVVARKPMPAHYIEYIFILM